MRASIIVGIKIAGSALFTAYGSVLYSPNFAVQPMVNAAIAAIDIIVLIVFIFSDFV